MRYIMKQKVFALGDKVAIRNENDEDAFFVDSAVLSLGQKLSFEDPQGNELLFIAQKLLSWGPTYELYRGEEHIATIKKEMFTFFKCTFDIHVDKGDLEARGDFSDQEYTVTRAPASPSPKSPSSGSLRRTPTVWTSLPAKIRS
jgi:uncharacterized protein YxjI